MKQTKQTYVSPRIEVIEVENEGVIAASGGLSDMSNTDGHPRHHPLIAHAVPVAATWKT